MDNEIIIIARHLGEALNEKRMKIATAESCTGGGIAQAITEIPGCSSWFDRGFVTYSNESKIDMLQVKQSTLDKYGAVSKQVAIEMVNGTLANSNANIAVSVTGIAGPDGGTEQKPVGTVFIAWVKRGKKANCLMQIFPGNRSQIRVQTIRYVLKQNLSSYLE